MLDATARFLADMWNFQRPYALTFLGPSGVGKTMLARLATAFFTRHMAGHKLDRDLCRPDEIWRCQGGFLDWGDALRTMLNTSQWERMSSYRGDFFLVLDDVMAESEKVRELSAAKLFEILNARQGRRWTIINGNCDLETVNDRLDPRIASRLIRDGNVCIELPPSTPDWALR